MSIPLLLEAAKELLNEHNNTPSPPVYYYPTPSGLGGVTNTIYNGPVTTTIHKEEKKKKSNSFSSSEIVSIFGLGAVATGFLYKSFSTFNQMNHDKEILENAIIICEKETTYSDLYYLSDFIIQEYTKRMLNHQRKFWPWIFG